MAKWNTVELGIVDVTKSSFEQYKDATLLYTVYNNPEELQYYTYYKAGAIDAIEHSKIYAAIIGSESRGIVIYAKSNDRGRCKYYVVQGYSTTPSVSSLNSTNPYKPDGLGSDAPVLYTYTIGSIGGWIYLDSTLPRYSNMAELYYDIYSPSSTPITYIPINSTLSGPESAASGESVNVSVSFPDGYIYQERGVSIYNKDGAIPFTYDNGTLTFTMP